MRLINLGFEAIEFQSPEFADKLVQCLNKILDSRDAKTAETSQAKKDLDKLINTSTGLNIKVIFDTDLPPCVLPFHFNPDTILGHVSLKEWYSEDLKRTMKRLEEIKASSYIDLKKGKVSGIFSIPEIPIQMSFKELQFGKLTVRETAAVLAHEIGHAFVAMEMAFRTSRTNQILASIAKAHGGGEQGQYEYVLDMSEKIIGLKTGVLEEVKNEKDGRVVMTVVMGKIEKYVQTESVAGNAVYDTTSFEALADNYAARLGFGRDLVTGLEKILKSYGAPEYSLITRIFITISNIKTVAFLILAPVIIASGNLIGIFALAMSVLSFFMCLDGRAHNNIYDKLTIRFKRIKEQIITYLKDNKLPSDVVKRSLEDVAFIEKSISQISEYKGFLPIIGNFIDPWSRATINARNLQQNLETVAANDLYLKAQALRIIE